MSIDAHNHNKNKLRKPFKLQGGSKADVHDYCAFAYRMSTLPLRDTVRECAGSGNPLTTKAVWGSKNQQF